MPIRLSDEIEFNNFVTTNLYIFRNPGLFLRPLTRLPLSHWNLQFLNDWLLPYESIPVLTPIEHDMNAYQIYLNYKMQANENLGKEIDVAAPHETRYRFARDFLKELPKPLLTESKVKSLLAGMCLFY